MSLIIPNVKEKRCSQCWKPKPIRQFISRSGKEITQSCEPCRDKYRGWGKKTAHEKLTRGRSGPRNRVGDGLHAALVLISHNRKTGPIPVSTTDMASCPDACGLKNKGCYAEYGNVLQHWRKVGNERGGTWEAFCAQVKKLRRGTLWRHNDAGDLPGKGDRLDLGAMWALIAANRGRKGFTFTHKPLLPSAERATVRRANDLGFTVNLSADSLEQADEKADWNVGPVVVVLPDDASLVRGDIKTPKGRPVIVCLAYTHDLQCIDCRLCAVPGRKSIVGFPAHGTARYLVSEIVREKRA